MLYLLLWLSLVFVLAIPGFVFAHLLLDGRHANWRPAVIIGTSLFGTYALVTYATLLHVSIYVAFLCLVALAALIFVRDRVTPTAEITDRYSLRAMVAGLIACAILVVCFWSYWRTTPVIFLGSDPVGTWNIWAKQWAAGQFPTLAYGYPQLVSTLWGANYVWLGETIQFGPTYLFILLLTLPPVAAAIWSGERHPILSLWMVGLYGGFTAHFRGWLGGSLPASFPDWLVVSFVTTAFVIAAPRLFGEPSRQDDDSAALATAQLYLCAAASIKPLAWLLALALIASSALMRYRSNRQDLHRSLLLQLLCIGAAIVTYLAYYVHVKNAVVLPPPRSTDFFGQMMDGLAFMAQSVFPLFLLLSAWGIAAAVSSRHLWPFSIACVAGFAIWAHKASYDLRNVLPFAVASLMLGVCAAASVLQKRKWIMALAERLVIPPGRNIRVSPYVTLLAFGVIVTGATFPLMRPDEDTRNAFVKASREIGLGADINAMGIDAVKRGCWVATNEGLFNTQDELDKFANKVVWLGFNKLDETSFQPILTSSCAFVIVQPSTLSDSARMLLAGQEQRDRLRRVVKMDWEIYASPALPLPRSSP